MKRGTPSPVAWLERVPAYAPGRPAPVGGLALASNEASSCSERVARVLADGQSWHRYPDPLATKLRHALAQHHGVTPEQILVSNGSDELVQLLVSAYVGYGGSVVAADPPYAMSRITTLANGAGFTGIPLINWTHDLETIASSESDIAYVVNPHNPTGTYHEVDAIAKFVEKARSKLVVIDEAYAEFATTFAKTNVTALVENGRTVVLRTFSKAYGLAGCRVGYLVGSEEIVERLRRVRAPFSVTGPSQLAALAALEDQAFLTRHIDEVARVRQVLRTHLQSMGWEVPDSQANFVLTVGVSEQKLVQFLAEAGIAVRAGSSLGLPGSVRITVPAEEDLPQLLRALDAAPIGLGDT